MTPPSLRSRIRNGTLLMLALALIAGAFAIPAVHRLGRSIRETLYRNYTSIEASQRMHAALYDVQLARSKGTLDAARLASDRKLFQHWIDVELNDITEPGEQSLADDIDRRGKLIFDQVARNPAEPPHSEFVALHDRLDELIDMNKQAMFRANSRAIQLSDRLAYEFAAGLLMLLVVGAALSWTIAWNISKPLADLSNYIRSFSLRGPSLRLGAQPLAELQTVASEFNRLCERLEQFEKLNVDRLVYEKNKTEAIVESIEDGIVLIDPQGIVTHINEVAGIVLGIERDDALGSPFDDLSSNSPHYLRVRSALSALTGRALESQRIEVDLHVRGRDHTYVLKPVPLKQVDGESLGTILILQDITYLRDKDRVRTNLVATLSHEIKTPLTSLGLAVELLMRKSNLGAEERDYLSAIQEDTDRMRRLANDLLDLARGQGAAITVQTVPVDLNEILRAAARAFAYQADQKGVRLDTSLDDNTPSVRGDPLKLSWVVSNLIANALRYTQSGGAISVSSGAITSGARFRVTDSGAGISPDLREHLFERYAQGISSNGAEAGSAGLGLAIVKEIVEAHGGRIFVDSEVGKGASFTVELPAQPESGFDANTSDRR